MIKAMLILTMAITASCGSNPALNVFAEPSQVAIDSTNNRLFIFDDARQIYVFTASDRVALSRNPIVDRNNQASIFASLPTGITNVALLSTGGGNTRLFITGSVTVGGASVVNRILTYDFNGTTFSQASFSPITVEDGDLATVDSVGGFELDAGNSRLYATDSTGGRLFAFSTSDGAPATLFDSDSDNVADATSTAIAGRPNKMSLHNGRLYIANSGTGVTAITIINTANHLATTIDLGIPTDDISVASNSAGTVMLAKHAVAQRVLVRTVDTATFALSSDIAAGNSVPENGALSAGRGISGGVGDMVLATDTSGNLFGYVPQSNGRIERLTFASNLASFTADEIITFSRVLQGIDLYTNADGQALTVYFVASATGELMHISTGSDQVGVSY